MDYPQRFTLAWDRLLQALPHDRQAEVMANPGGFEWKQLAAQAAIQAE